MLLVAPSILSADFSKLNSEIKSISNADFVHIDVMDGHFVPNITMGACVVNSIRKTTNILFDVHLMVSNPLRFIEEFAKSGSDYISVHIECEDSVNECIKLIKKSGKKAGIAISPDTNPLELQQYLDDIDIITVMSVYPGFGGQSFIENTYDKIKIISNMIKNSYRNIILSVDGGVNKENAGKLLDCGVSMVVAGSSVFNYDDRTNAINELKR